MAVGVLVGVEVAVGVRVAVAVGVRVELGVLVGVGVGSTLPASALRFDPPSLDELPARSSRGVVVAADVAEGVPRGAYRGVLLVAGAPDVWLPIVVTVASGG